MDYQPVLPPAGGFLLGVPLLFTQFITIYCVTTMTLEDAAMSQEGSQTASPEEVQDDASYQQIEEVLWGPSEADEKYDVDQELAPMPKGYAPEGCHCPVGSTCSDESCVMFACFEECYYRTCPAGSSCRNRRLQQQEFKKVKVIRAPEKAGKGLIAGEDIKAGDLVYEYVGEAVLEKHLPKLFRRYQRERKLYIMALGDGVYLDACRKGSVARYINHSCEPNCRVDRWKVRGRLRAAIIALKDIPSGTELSFDYKWERRWGRAPTKCHCGTPSCRGTLELTKTLDYQLFQHPSIEWQEITRFDYSIVNRAVRKPISEDNVESLSEEVHPFVYAEITGYDPSTALHHILYSPDMEVWEDLRKDGWMILDDQVTLEHQNFIIAKKSQESQQNSASKNGSLTADLLSNAGVGSLTKNYLFIQTPVKNAMKSTIERVQTSCQVLVTAEQLSREPFEINKNDPEEVEKSLALDQSRDGTVWKLSIAGNNIERALELLEKGSAAISRRLDDATPPPTTSNQQSSFLNGHVSNKEFAVTHNRSEVVFPRSLDDKVLRLLPIWRDKLKAVNLTSERQQRYSCIAVDAGLPSDLEVGLLFIFDEIKLLCESYRQPTPRTPINKYPAVLGGTLRDNEFQLIVGKNTEVYVETDSRSSFFSSYETATACGVVVEEKTIRSDREGWKLYFACPPGEASNRFKNIQDRINDIQMGVLFVPVSPGALKPLVSAPFISFIAEVTGASLTEDKLTIDQIRIDGRINGSMAGSVPREVLNMHESERAVLAGELLSLQLEIFRDRQKRQSCWAYGRDWLHSDLNLDVSDASSPFQQLDIKGASQGSVDIAEIVSLLGLKSTVSYHASVILYRFVAVLTNDESLKSVSTLRDVVLACVFIANKCQKTSKWRRLEQVLEKVFSRDKPGLNFDRKNGDIRAQARRVIQAEREILDILDCDVFVESLDSISRRVLGVLERKTIESLLSFICSGQSLSAGAEVWLKFGPSYLFCIGSGLMTIDVGPIIHALGLSVHDLIKCTSLFLKNAKIGKLSSAVPSHLLLENRSTLELDLESFTQKLAEFRDTDSQDNFSKPLDQSIALFANQSRILEVFPSNIVYAQIVSNCERIMTESGCHMFLEASKGQFAQIVLTGSWRAVTLAEKYIESLFDDDTKFVKSPRAYEPKVELGVDVPSSRKRLNFSHFKVPNEARRKEFMNGTSPEIDLKAAGLRWLVPPRYGSSVSQMLYDVQSVRTSKNKLESLSSIANFMDDGSGRFSRLLRFNGPEKTTVNEKSVALAKWPNEKVVRKEAEKFKQAKGKAMKFGFSPGALQEMQLLNHLHCCNGSPHGHPNFIRPVCSIGPVPDGSDTDYDLQENGTTSKDIKTDDPVLSILNSTDAKEQKATRERRARRSYHLLLNGVHFSLAQLISKKKDEFLVDKGDLMSTWFFDVLSALAHCHASGVVVGQINPEHIVIEGSGVLKFASLSRASVFNTEAKEEDSLKLALKGEDKRKKEKKADEDPSKDQYVAPELLLGSPKVSKESDMWSAGCLFAHMLLGKPLFAGKDRQSLLSSQFKIVGSPGKGNFEKGRKFPKFRKEEKKYQRAVEKALRRLLPERSPQGDEAIDLVASMLHLDPSLRVSASEALESKFAQRLLQVSEAEDFQSSFTEQWRSTRKKLTQASDSEHDAQRKEKRKAMLMASADGNNSDDDLYGLDDLLGSGNKKKVKT